jgi:hypothetical protein
MVAENVEGVQSEITYDRDFAALVADYPKVF